MKNGQKKNVKLQIRKWNKNIVQFEVVKESYSSKTLNHEILTLKMEKMLKEHNDWTWKKRGITVSYGKHGNKLPLL